MFWTLRATRLFWPALSALVGLAVLFSLGTWQLERKAWKEGVVRLIEARTRSKPMAFDAFLSTPHRGAEPIDYTRVRVRGHFAHDREIHLHAIESGVAGWYVVTPLTTPAGATVLVNRGFVTDALKDRANRLGGLIEGEAEFNGLIRALPTAKGWFVPDNDLARNQWYWLDPAAAQAVATQDKRPLTAIVVEQEPVHVAVPPAGGATRLVLPNRHLAYAVTWYGLALTLVGVFAAFARARMRATTPRRS